MDNSGAENRKEIRGIRLSVFNAQLQDPQDGLPAVSLSVGGAFSETGFHADLFRQADKALYRVKGQGRRGCRFYAKDAPPIQPSRDV